MMLMHCKFSQLNALSPCVSAVNTYLFMMQAHGILIRENMRTIGAQVYEQMVRGAYIRKNNSIDDTGK